jgi:hypothetical protein
MSLSRRCPETFPYSHKQSECTSSHTVPSAENEQSAPYNCATMVGSGERPFSLNSVHSYKKDSRASNLSELIPYNVEEPTRSSLRRRVCVCALTDFD